MTPVALSTGDSRVGCKASSRCLTVAATSPGDTSPYRASFWTSVMTPRITCGANRVLAACTAGSASSRSVEGIARRGSALTEYPFLIPQAAPAACGHRREFWRRRTGLEPARPSYLVSSALKTAGTTRNPDASKNSNYHVCRRSPSSSCRRLSSLRLYSYTGEHV